MGTAISVSAGDVWVVSAHVSRAGHSSPLRRTLDKNAGAYW